MPLFSNLEDYTGKYAIATEYPDYDWKTGYENHTC